MTKTKKMKKIIETVFIDAIAEMFFVDVIVAEDEELSIDCPIICRLSILLPHWGELILVFSEDIARELIENTLGGNVSEQKSKMVDAVGEFANVFAGKLINEISPNMLFELGLPKIIDKSSFDITNSSYYAQYFQTPCKKFAVVYCNFKNEP
ncbi:MAG: chemotaxis protein CheX [Bacteriovoracaceae bacterium]|nr:chemotaxis protein CheX [Bacteriovoracaceae bacterium]